jgi:hypothetical protein
MRAVSLNVVRPGIAICGARLTTLRRVSMRPGTKPSPRLRLNPAFVHAVRESQRAIWMIALICEFPHASALSHLLNADQISATPLNVARLQQVAFFLEFPTGEIFEREAEVQP